jgi:hypothetical protein
VGEIHIPAPGTSPRATELRELIAERMHMIRIHAEIIERYTWIDEDLGVCFQMPRLISQAKAALAAFNDLQEITRARELPK